MNLSNLDQARRVGGINALLAITASNTTGTPIHQDDAEPSVRIHQMIENRSPRDRLIEPLFVTLILFILYRLWVNLYSLASLSAAG